MGTRLEGIYEEAFKEALHELSEICPVSIENAIMGDESHEKNY